MFSQCFYCFRGEPHCIRPDCQNTDNNSFPLSSSALTSGVSRYFWPGNGNTATCYHSPSYPSFPASKYVLDIFSGSWFSHGFIRVSSLMPLFKKRHERKTQGCWFLLGFVRVDVKHFFRFLLDNFQESWFLLGFIRVCVSCRFSKFRKGLFSRLRNEIRKGITISRPRIANHA